MSTTPTIPSPAVQRLIRLLAKAAMRKKRNEAAAAAESKAPRGPDVRP
jgi:hypothetical protein